MCASLRYWRESAGVAGITLETGDLADRQVGGSSYDDRAPRRTALLSVPRAAGQSHFIYGIHFHRALSPGGERPRHLNYPIREPRRSPSLVRLPSFLELAELPVPSWLRGRRPVSEAEVCRDRLATSCRCSCTWRSHFRTFRVPPKKSSGREGLGGPENLNPLGRRRRRRQGDVESRKNPVQMCRCFKWNSPPFVRNCSVV